MQGLLSIETFQWNYSDACW